MRPSEPSLPRRPGVLRGLHQWSRRHPVLDGMVLGPITLVALLIWRGVGILPLSLGTCLLIALAATALGACAGLNNRRRNRRRAERGEPDSALPVFLGLSDSQPSPCIGRVILPAVFALALAVGVASAIIGGARADG